MNNKEKILLVDDEPDMITFIRDALEDEGYRVEVASTGEEAITKLTFQPDLILLDIMMPGIDGFEVCRTIRDTIFCPILFLSAKQAETDRILGLATGADDFITKPFSIKELKARINAHLRREQRAATKQSQRTVLRYGPLTIDLTGYHLHVFGQLIHLTSREFQIIQFLALHPKQVFSREQIYEKVWGYDGNGDSSTVTEHVKKIRAKLAARDPQGAYITTVWGVGYKWEQK
ncbi:response regulator transcription factor [Mechercharimyces sp. CAU 1602]|uniref:response regulator transcription factor n=1 Tax=Mechercharimyces sp. CAU 1602 TaxID=2973933 RepID=UPI002161F2ED|nr:response regulator transcription factor [Mechercharimyces sp. CAU 1602]MCS1350675.1 response regulator transcription factor [Mechercharimyces sp. CAU 1602]